MQLYSNIVFFNIPYCILFIPYSIGAAFALGKIPIAATDFGIPVWYSYADEEQIFIRI